MKSILCLSLVLCSLLGGCRAPNASVPAAEPGSTVQSGGEPAAQPVPRHSRPDLTGKPGQFDFYLLTLSWSPEFCVTHAQAPECTLHLGYIVHGLWPQNKNSTYPEDCSNQPGPANPAAWSDLFPDASLLAHEWTTHGTCSGLAADAYLGQIRTAFHKVAIPAQLNTVAPGTMLAPGAILADFAKANPSFPKGSLALSCGNNRLTAVQVCLSKALQPIACVGVKTCGATVVKIAPHAAH